MLLKKQSQSLCRHEHDPYTEANVSYRNTIRLFWQYKIAVIMCA